MINLVICDDEQKIRDMLAGYIRRFSEETGEEFAVRQFASGSELIADYPIDTDIALIDIMMGAVNGIETAQEIRRHSRDVVIIFITQTAQYALNAYKVRAFGYLTKPLRYADLKYELSEAVQKLRTEADEYITVRSGSGVVRVALGDVKFVEAQNHSFVVHTPGGELRIAGPLSDVESQLEGRPFFRCHRAYIVGLRWLLRLEGAAAVLRGGGEVPVSKYRRAELMKSFARYLGKVM